MGIPNPKIGRMSGRVFLWSAPRSLSSAFTRAMLNLDECEVLMEPYWEHHLSLWGYQSRGWVGQTSEQLKLSADQTTAFIQSCEKKFVFVKELPKDVGVPPYYFDDQKLPGFQHTFLLRHPEKTIQSLYRIYSKEFPETASIDFSDQAGFKQLYETYNFASKHSATPPIVIFADDLLEDPEKVFKYYCDHTGLPYKKNMSCWEPGPVEGWSHIEYFESLYQSSGIGKVKSSCNHAVINEKKEPCATVKKAIQDNIWYFEEMYEKRVKF